MSITGGRSASAENGTAIGCDHRGEIRATESGTPMLEGWPGKDAAILAKLDNRLGRIALTPSSC